MYTLQRIIARYDADPSTVQRGDFAWLISEVQAQQIYIGRLQQDSAADRETIEVAASLQEQRSKELMRLHKRLAQAKAAAEYLFGFWLGDTLIPNRSSDEELQASLDEAWRELLEAFD